MTKVAAVDAFLADIDDFAEFNRIYQEYFADYKPARAVVGVKGLSRGALVEINCIAAK